MSVLYLLFRVKGWEPGRYWNMNAGERALVRGFLSYELEQRHNVSPGR